MAGNSIAYRLACDEMYSSFMDAIGHTDFDPADEAIVYAALPGQGLFKSSMNIMVALYTLPEITRDFSGEGPKTFFLNLGNLGAVTWHHCELFVKLINAGKVSVSGDELNILRHLAKMNAGSKADKVVRPLERDLQPSEKVCVEVADEGLKLVKKLAASQHPGRNLTLVAFNDEEIVSKYDLLARAPVLLESILSQPLPTEGVYHVLDVPDNITFRFCASAIRGNIVPNYRGTYGHKIYCTLKQWINNSSTIIRDLKTRRNPGCIAGVFRENYVAGAGPAVPGICAAGAGAGPAVPDLGQYSVGAGYNIPAAGVDGQLELGKSESD